ncbi:MAG: RNA polymerase sigma factor [Flavobacteriaceae bacterium]
MKGKKIHGDQKYVDGLLQNNPFVIQSIYDLYAPKVINYIKRNNGDLANAQDVIQETLITIYNQAKTENLQLTCPFDAYFFLLCKRKWLNQLKKASKKEVTINEEMVYKDEGGTEQVFETSLFEQQYNLFEEMFQKLGKSCKDVLRTSFKVKTMDEVAKILGVSYAYARKKKSLCIGKLTQMIKETPAYQQLKQ